MEFTIKGSYNEKESHYFFWKPNLGGGFKKSPRPFDRYVQNSHMHPIRSYGSDCLCERENNPKEGRVKTLK